METTAAFFGGIVFTVFAIFIYYKWDTAQQRKRDRRMQATRRTGPYPPDAPRDNGPDRFEP